MKSIAAMTLSLGLAASMLGAQPRSERSTTVTWTGWFSDKGCAHVVNGETRPNNTACVKKCLDEGSKAVFISEQAKAIFEVVGYPAVKDDVGYRVELTGTVDADAGTIAVKSVKHLSEVVNMCAVPKKK